MSRDLVLTPVIGARAIQAEAISTTGALIYRNLPPGRYTFAAENGGVYYLDGAQNSYNANSFDYIEARDMRPWNSESGNGAVSFYLEAGATLRIVKRA